MPYKEISSIIAIILTMAAFYPYIRGTIQGTVKPHVFTWVIWGLGTLIVALAQLQDEGGLGGWVTLFSSLLTIYIAVLAYQKRADITISRSDKASFIAAMAAIPLWYITNDPLAAVIIITVIDILGYLPTLRKTYHQPHTESLAFFSILAIRTIFILLALENYTLTTTLFHSVISVACMVQITTIIWRRKAIAER